MTVEERAYYLWQQAGSPMCSDEERNSFYFRALRHVSPNQSWRVCSGELNVEEAVGCVDEVIDLALRYAFQNNLGLQTEVEAICEEDKVVCSVATRLERLGLAAQ